MTSQEFNNLKYGNVITAGGFSGVLLQRMIVLHVKKDANGNVTEIGVINSLNIASAGALQLENPTAEETIIVNGILQSKTITSI